MGTQFPQLLKILAAPALALLVSGCPLLAQEANDPSTGIVEIPFSQLTDQTLSPSGQRALAIHPDSWKHGETPHFVIHFLHRFVATPVALEAEFYYRYLMKDLDIAPSTSGKSHLYIFETGADWEQFIHGEQLEEWTGAVTIGNDLFVPRNPQYKFKGNSLGHEITHLVVHRFLGTHLPLWLEEGYAEDASLRGYATYYRMRGYNAKPPPVASPAFIPLATLMGFNRYPSEPYVELFYHESRRVTGFLNGFGEHPQFLKFLKEMAQGTPFDSALRDGYGSKWLTLDDLETDFKKHDELFVQGLSH